MIPVVKKAVAAIGSLRKMAKLLDIERGAIYQWKNVPAVHVLKIEELTMGAVDRHQMRPDVFGKKPKAAA
jgi:DNA-binding transcriptional regulator YdaS (Cro superfamily)